MIHLVERARAVLRQAWQLLPRRKLEALVHGVELAELGAKHGSYDPHTGLIRLDRRLFRGPPVLLIDDQGGEAPRRGPAVSRALHTTIHELAHAIGRGTGLDEHPSWLALSGWQETAQDGRGTGRYFERRPGWANVPSPWCYRHGTWFCRAYSSRSPYEDFADCVTARALGWTHVFTVQGHGRDKLAFVNRYVWGEQALDAAMYLGPGVLAVPLPARRLARWLGVGPRGGSRHVVYRTAGALV